MVSLFGGPYFNYPDFNMAQKYLYELSDSKTALKIDSIDIVSTQTLKLENEKGKVLKELSTEFGLMPLEETTVKLSYLKPDWNHKNYSETQLFFKISVN
uniref:Uncharacterized protein n=1 Tax=Panagrolaimus davidi TaxID=227884 RepID=A0A914P0J3_9BILA